MTLADEIKHDYRYLDGVEEVSLTPQNPAGSPVSGVKALRRILSAKPIGLQDSIALEPDDLVFHLWDATLGGAVPKNGDALADSDSVVWIILSITKTTLGTRWRAICRKQVS